MRRQESNQMRPLGHEPKMLTNIHHSAIVFYHKELLLSNNSTIFMKIGYKINVMSKKKKKTEPKERNWIAVHAFNRKGGAMKNNKKERNKKACRKKIKY